MKKLWLHLQKWRKGLLWQRQCWRLLCSINLARLKLSNLHLLLQGIPWLVIHLVCHVCIFHNICNIDLSSCFILFSPLLCQFLAVQLDLQMSKIKYMVFILIFLAQMSIHHSACLYVSTSAVYFCNVYLAHCADIHYFDISTLFMIYIWMNGLLIYLYLKLLV